MRAATVLLALLLLTLGLAGCPGDAGSEPDAVSNLSSIEGGTVGGSPAVVAVLAEMSGDFTALCSGTLIGQRTVLTAAHCLVNKKKRLLGVHVRTGVDVFDDPHDTVKVTRARITPAFCGADAVRCDGTGVQFGDVDVALLRLERQPRHYPKGQSKLQPLAPVGVYGAKTLPGDKEIKLVGYGRTQCAVTEGDCVVGIQSAGEAGIKHTGYGQLAWWTQERLYVRGTDGHTCAGDSGSPLFVRYGTGWRVAGVDHAGYTNACAKYTTGPRLLASRHVDPFIKPFLAGGSPGCSVKAARARVHASCYGEADVSDDACPLEWYGDGACDLCLGDDPDCELGGDAPSEPECPLEWYGDGLCDPCLGDDPDCASPTDGCSDECVSGERRCVDQAQYDECGQWDDDPCTEWSQWSCATWPGTVCSDGWCVNP